MPDPTTFSQPVPTSTMRTPGEGVTESPYRQISANDATSMSLGVATVMQVDYAKHEVTLRTENGETFEWTPTAMTYPSAGVRHFLGALPLPGDVALVGWGFLESGKSRQPFVLGWFPGGVMAGHDHWPVQPFGQDEYDLTPKDQAVFEGVANRRRHKLRHMLPGNIVGSSAQGSDLVLDESVLLANRRGNELRLRDQDQALVVRTLQQFHAGAGFRVYSGIVQRDATFLPTSMFSDGTDWAAAQQLTAEGVPLDETALAESDVASGYLTPNKVFQRDSAGQRIASFPTTSDGQAANPFGGNVDPYVFLQKGLFVDGAGRSTTSPSDAVYAGKAVYRVSSEGSNAAVDPFAEALTEYRIEVSHLSDGTLPVTEQTDGFDADRLPGTVPRLPSGLNDSLNSPFIEFVMGSVVGNDPFSIPGRALYGVPIRPEIFPGGNPVSSPALGSGVGGLVTEHAAVLLRVSPPLDASSKPSFWSILKDGRVRASVEGPGTDFSAEMSFGAGAHLYAGATPSGESFLLQARGKVSIRTERGSNVDNRGIEIASDTGSVLIRGDGVDQVGTTVAPTSDGATPPPAVLITSQKNVQVQAGGTLTLSAQRLNLQDVNTLLLSTQAALALQSGDSINQTSKTRNVTSMGKSVETFSGPKDNLPTNGSVRSVAVNTTPATGFLGGTADEYSLVYGDRDETLTAGNHTTTVVVGNLTYQTRAGTWQAISGTNQLVLSSAGLLGNVQAGAVVVSASAGTATITAAQAVSVISTGGTALVRGTTVILSASGGKTGGIVSGADLDPVSGLPLQSLGMGSLTQLLASA